ncbi:hypothetical protein WMY93_003978 [Mugilogobius chulae]|uniref:Leucine-rich repeat-containing protein 43 n=1 Tax=Mugilogobius chulae TaxID=88201 RepID=A0AAW0PMG8_9GOBI
MDRVRTKPSGPESGLNMDLDQSQDYTRTRKQNEDPQSLLDLLDCPASPWHQEPDWSPQAAALRRRAVLSPKQLSKSTVYKTFTALRLTDKSVCELDDTLLKLSNLEELVLSANQLQESLLRCCRPHSRCSHSLDLRHGPVLELQNNRLTSLCPLTSRPPPRLLYLGLASNPLGSPPDVCSLTGKHWPALRCLDLSFCDFERQRVLLGALSSLPCLKSLLLEGNPCSLSWSYPGLTLDVLPQLLYLDSEWVRAEERERSGAWPTSQTAETKERRAVDMLDEIYSDGGEQDLCAGVTVHMSRLRGLPDPPPQTSDYPPVFTYHVSYMFLPVSALEDMKDECRSEADVTEEEKGQDNSEQKNQQEKNCEQRNQQEKNCEQRNQQEKNCEQRNQQEKNCEQRNQQEKNCEQRNQQEKNCEQRKQLEKNHEEPGVCEVCCEAHGSAHSSSKLSRSQCEDFSESQHHSVSDLRALKGFLLRGMCVRVEEEKIQCWPAAAEDNAKEAKGAKGKETTSKKGTPNKGTPNKAAPTKEKKLKAAAVELVQDRPVRRVLGSVHVPLHTLLLRGHKVALCCDFGPQGSGASAAEADNSTDQDVGKPVKEDSKGGASGKKSSTAKGKAKGKEVDVPRVCGPQEPLSLELCVELHRWKSAAEASEQLRLVPSHSMN